MNINLNQTTAINPPAFGMPSFGHAFETRTAGITSWTSAPAIVRDREDISVKGGMGLAQAYVPVPSWSPPIS